ncbi:MAG: helix-turn-helix transcriptional regulator [Gammaproteobacteria bacterium]|nr:helix-turn-helix transcriptional regulator [Gammaproteobacteria bacterium]
MYWEMVLNEVVNREASGEFRFTNFGCMAATDKSVRETKKSFKRRKPEGFKLGKEYPDVKFSRREAECMVMFLQGMTMRDTAQALDLSPRTVEFYVKNMRQKVGCRTKSELINIVANSDFVLLLEERVLTERKKGGE